MARQGYNYVFGTTTPYVDDRGETRPGIRGSLKLPPDLPGVTGQRIIEEMLRGISQPGSPSEYSAALVSSPCPENASFEPRKLTFVRKDGSSLSAIVPNRISIDQRARQIKDIFGNAENPVMCVRLDGEEFGDIRFELSTSPPSTERGNACVPPATATKASFYKMIMNYASDGSDSGRFVRVKIKTDRITDGVPEPPSDLSSAWGLCTGEPLAQADEQCAAGSRKRTLIPRHYILHRRVSLGGDNFTETNEVPIAEDTPTIIKQLGTELTGVRGVYCLRYKGETNLLFHRYL